MNSARQKSKCVRLPAIFGRKIIRAETVALCLFLTLAATSRADEFDTLRISWLNSLITIATNASSPAGINSKAAGYQSTMVPTMTSGSTGYLWSDLPLGAKDTVGSQNIVDTYKRLADMAQAYATPGCALYNDATLATAVASGLDWMNTTFYTKTTTLYGNWFDWEVQAPTYLNNAITLIYPALSSAQVASYIQAMYNFGPDSYNEKDYFWWGALTGANTVSAAQVMAIQGVLLGSNTTTVARYWHDTTGHPVNPQPDYVISGSNLLAEARGNLSGDNPEDWDGDSVFRNVTGGDGFYDDGSYVFHGNIAYLGHYGLVELEGEATLINFLYGSPWEITDPDLSNIYDRITKGFEPLIYNGAMMDMVRGRSIGDPGETEYTVGSQAIAAIRQVAQFAPSNIATALTAFANSPRLPSGQFHFAGMDRVVALRPSFGLGLSMSSTRIATYEHLFNTSNLKGWHTGDGMTYLYLGETDTQFTGDFWPTVDYYHLPGTTVEQPTTAPSSTTDQDWVGGAEVQNTNGVAIYGAAGMSLHPPKSSGSSTLYGKKSWFMFDSEVACLGAGITCSSSNQVDTTVENRRLGVSPANNLWINGEQKPPVIGWSSNINSATYCVLEGVGGYYFPGGATNLQASFVANSGSWSQIKPGESATVYTDNYLKLLFNHGVTPTNATYAYVILPGMSAGSVGGYALNPGVIVITNTTSVQAVKKPVIGVVAANFWIDAGGTADLITANKKSSVITRETYNSISVGVSDPTQNNGDSITVTLNRSALSVLSSDPGVTVLQITPTIILQADVNGSNGKTFHAAFELAPAPIITGNLNLAGLTGNALSYQITADNSPVSYGASGLPPGLSVDADTGLISGTPTQAGTFLTVISAASADGRSGNATLTIIIGNVNTDISYSITMSGLSTWVCPANMTAVQVECWGGGGAGGGASRNGQPSGGARAGGGAGGAYAKLNGFPVIPGNTYYISVGAGGVSVMTDMARVSGGDSWFNTNNTSSTNIIAKGGAGGETVLLQNTSNRYGGGGVGTTNGSAGNVVYAGGNGGTPTSSAVGGSGGGSGGTGSAGNPGSATSGTGATAVPGGGPGGNPNPSGTSASGQAPLTPPGGGGGGARCSNSSTTLTGGPGAAGQIVLTYLAKIPPSVSLTAPTNGASYLTPVSITLTADASSATSTITTVDFYNGATLIGSDTEAPYACTWTNVGAGSYNLTARATDNSGAVSTSAVAVITVADPVYTLTVNSGTGGGSYTNGRQVAIAASPISGKAFVQWVGDTQYVNNVAYTNALVTMSTNAVALTATYVDVYYALTVIGGSGGGGTYTNGTKVAISADAPAFEKVFDRWAGDTQVVNNVTYTNALVTMPAQAVTLTATYKDITHTLTVIGGTGGGSYTNGRQVSISANTPAIGKAFGQWIGDTQHVNNVTYTNALVTISTNAVSLTATYVDVYYALTVTGGIGGGGTHTNGTQVDISANAPAIGKAFDKWIGATQYVAGITAANTTVTMPAQAIALSATYVDLYYALTVNSGTGGGSCTNTQVVAISADAPAPGKAFSQWTGDTQVVNNVTYTNALVTMSTNAVNLTATYVDVYYALTVNSGTGGGLYTNGTQVAVTASNLFAKTFVVWTGDTQYVNNVTYTNALVTISTNAVSLSATYEDVLYTLTVTGGSGSGFSYTNAQVVDISADTPIAGMTFDRWIGDTQAVASVTAANTTVTMPAQAVALSATYKNLPGYYTLTVSNGTGGGVYTNGTQVTIMATAPEGTAFARWTGDAQVVAGVFSLSTIVTMPAQDTALTATCVDASNGVASVTWASGYIFYEPTWDSLLGPVGSGKSTIAQLMYSPDDIKDSILPGGAGAVNDVVWDTITLTENGDGQVEWGLFSASTVRAGTNGYVYALIFQDNDVQAGDLYVAGPLLPLVDGLADVNTCADPGNGEAINGVNSAQVVEGTQLTVNSGTGGGWYTNGQQVAISANAPAAGKVFDKWTGDTQVVNNVTYTNALVTLSINSVTLTATYVDIRYARVINYGSGIGAALATNGTVEAICADDPAPGMIFFQWVGDTEHLADSNAACTTLTMPAANVDVAATYKSSEQYTTNGTPHSWLDQYGLTNHVVDDALDQDSDGLKAWQEHIAGTVPTNGASCFKAAQSNRNVISWSPVTGRIYSVYWSTNLVKGFTNLNDNIPYPQSSYTNATPDPRVNHYQIKVRMQ